MMVRFEEDEYIAVAIFDAGNRVQTMEAMDEIFSYLDEDMKLLIFTTIQKLYYLSDEGYEEQILFCSLAAEDFLLVQTYLHLLFPLFS